MEDVERMSAQDGRLIDSRTFEEYIGDIKKKRGGHIAGAKWWEWSRSVDFSSGFIHKPAKVLHAELKTLGLDDKNSRL